MWGLIECAILICKKKIEIFLLTYLLRKALLLLVSLWCVVTGTFFLMHAIPGDPFIGDRVIPQEMPASFKKFIFCRK